MVSLRRDEGLTLKKPPAGKDEGYRRDCDAYFS